MIVNGNKNYLVNILQIFFFCVFRTKKIILEEGE